MIESQIDQFLHLYWRGNEDLITDDHFDLDKFAIPGCPGDRYIGAFSVRYDPQSMRHDLPKPNLKAEYEGLAYGLWFIATFDSDDSESSKAKNLRLMVSQSLASNLKGAPIDRFLNPFVFERTEFHSNVHTLGGMRTTITKAGLWSGTTLHAELLSRGGSRTTPEKARAARENQKKATLASMAKRAEDDAAVAMMIESGMSVVEIAEVRGRSVEAIEKALIRANLRRSR